MTLSGLTERSGAARAGLDAEHPAVLRDVTTTLRLRRVLQAMVIGLRPIGITLPSTFFALLVTHGITRRMLAVAGSIYLVGAAAATATLWVLVYQVEHLIYVWQGWDQALANPHLFTRTSQLGLIFAEFFLLVVSHEVTGWLLGITLYRFGFWKGILLLPLALVPAVAAEFLLVAQWLAQALENTGYHRPPLGVAAPGVLAVSALGLYFGYLLIRPMGLKPAKG